MASSGNSTMSAPYSSRASAIIVAMRSVLPATSPTGKSNWAMAMRSVSVMSDSVREHVEGGKYGLSPMCEIGDPRAQHAHWHAHDLRRIHDQPMVGYRQGRHQPLQRRSGPFGRDQRHDHARADRLDEVALYVQQVWHQFSRGRVGIGVGAELAHLPAPPANARTWSTSMPSRSMRLLYASIASRLASSHCPRRRERTSASNAFSSVAERLMSKARASSSRP